MKAYINDMELPCKENITARMAALAALPFSNPQQYGTKIPTSYMVKHNNRWKRVYCRIYSNIGSLYIMQGKEKININIER